MPWKSSLEQEVRCLFHPDSSRSLRCQPPVNHTPQSPVLVIGLGGLGSRTMMQVRRQVRTYFAQADVFARFLSIDTDAYPQQNERLDDHERCVMAGWQAGELLSPAGRQALPPFITEWLNPALSVGPGASGACAIRQVGRLMLFMHAQQVYGALCAALDAIRTLPGPIQVFVVSGTCGGTGSGILLDVAYLLRHAAMQLGIQDRITLSGMLFMPDVHPFPESQLRSVLESNAYAAVKELDCWMHAAETGRSLVQQYTPGLMVQWAGRPFDDCFLLSADPAVRPAQTDACARTAAALIASIIGVDEVAAPGWYAAFRQAAAQHPHPHAFTTVTLREGVLPMQELLREEAGLLASSLDACESASRHPGLYSDQVFSDFLYRHAGNAVENFFAPVVKYNSIPFSLSELRSGAIPPLHNDSNPDVAGYFTALQRRSAMVPKLIAPIVQSVEDDLYNLFRSSRHGPFYVARFLSATPVPFAPKDEPIRTGDLMRALELWRQSTCNQLDAAKSTYSLHHQKASQAYQDICRRFLILPNSPIVRQYLESCEALCQAMRMVHISTARLHLIEAITEQVRRLSRNVFLPLCAALNGFMHACREDAAFAPDSPQQPLTPVETLTAYLHSAFTPAFSESLVQMLADDMIHPGTPAGERWLVDCMGKTVGVRLCENMQRVLNAFFRGYGDLTLPQAWRLHQPAPGFAPDAPLTPQEVQTGIATALALPASAFRTDDAQITADLLMLPTAAIGPGQPDVIPGRYADRAVHIRFIDGVAPFHHPDWERCRQQYAAFRQPGMHLRESMDDNWINLPDPVND
ncbi:MAG: hypothetical protein IKK75_11565 [Clostridia bacterium]|nr:hypothetical protein [Clostridia bacterium]